jgi:hypothetical protein
VAPLARSRSAPVPDALGQGAHCAEFSNDFIAALLAFDITGTGI